jgi:phosphoglycerol transferase MdoB-like AlkP superfamily enzyme
MVKEDKNRDGRFRCYALLIISALFAPFLIRLVLLTGRAGFSLTDLHGFLSDAVLSLFIVLLILLVSSKRRVFGIVIVLLWSLANYGAYEHVMALGALPGLAHAGYLADKTFLISSALTVSNPILFLAVIIMPIVLLWLASRVKGVRFSLPAVLIAAMMLLSVNLVWKIDHASLMWRQTNFLDDNFRIFFTSGKGAAIDSVGSEVEGLSNRADLGGIPIVKIPKTKTNVLLIMLESVSGAYIETASKYHNIKSNMTMERLSMIAEENIVYTSFVANQRQTNRGEYALLCGEYPRLNSGVAKMSEYVQKSGTKTCLPKVLKDEGYETVYLQSAPLAFMLKDQFMEAIGFEKVYGDDYFKNAYKRSTWGVDDKAYFEESVNMLEELEGKGKPWFLTMLTVGTHDPYIVPDNYSSHHKAGTLNEAMGYLDSAVADFLDTLEARGILENTLVVITSDESAGLRDETSDLISKLSQNWGALIVKLPTKERKKIDKVFMQADIPLSILDYLDFSAKAGEFSGRSFFRRYNRGREIFFGNTYMRLLGSFTLPDKLNLCDEGFRRCDTFEIEGERWFSPRPEGVTMNKREKERLMAASRASGELTDGFKGFEMELISKRTVELSIEDTQLIFGGQYIDIPAGTRLDIDLEIEVVSSQGRVKLLSDLVSRYIDEGEESERSHFNKVTPLMGPNDRARISYSYYPSASIDKLEVRLLGKVIEDGPIEINVIKASLKAVSCKDEACGEEDAKIGEARIREMSLNGAPFGK